MANNSAYKVPVVKDSLMKKIANYDVEAFNELYTITSAAVYGYAMSILKSSADAEEVLQEVFINIYQKIDSYRYKKKAMAWIFTITRNSALMKVRSNTKHQTRDIDNEYDIASATNIETQVENQVIVNEALSMLDDVDREIIVMHSMTYMKHKDIAVILNLPLSTVLSKYRRGLKKIRNYLEEMGYER
jgi:RNA polymerase sigma-70 factor (ECF subfamily)